MIQQGINSAIHLTRNRKLATSTSVDKQVFYNGTNTLELALMYRRNFGKVYKTNVGNSYEGCVLLPPTLELFVKSSHVWCRVQKSISQDVNVS